MVDINLPITLEFRDEIDLEYLHKQLKKVIPQIQCEYLGAYFRCYAIFFIEKDAAYDKMKKSVQDNLRLKLKVMGIR